LNPAHPDFRRLRINEPEAFHFDPLTKGCPEGKGKEFDTVILLVVNDCRVNPSSS
jgi:hypothetical protein